MAEVKETKMACYAQAFRERVRQDERAVSSRRRTALELASRLAVVLLNQFGATAVYLFGSTATGRHYGPNSDIDLAVSGIAPEREIHTHARINLLSEPGFAVDLLFMESAPDIFLERVRKDGVLLGQRQ